MPQAILPPEVIDDIVVEACNTLDSFSVSSIALASHTCRLLANQSRFSSLAISNKSNPHRVQHTSHRISTLADAIRTGHSVAAMPGICTFATSFSLRIVGFSDEVDLALNDGSLAYIFNNLLRPSPFDDQWDSTLRSLQLYVYREMRNDSIGLWNPGLDWSRMSPGLSRAFEELLRVSKVDQISLRHIHQIPSDLLQISRLKRLHLQTVSFSRAEFQSCDSLELDSRGRAGNLEYLDINHPAEVIFKTGHNMLPHLTELTTNNTTVNMTETVNVILRSAPALRSLKVGRSRWQADISYPRNVENRMEYSHLKHIESIVFTSCNHSQLREISQVVHCDKPLPPSLTNLEIRFRLFSRFPTVESVIRILENLDIGMLDKYLINPLFDQFTRITFGVVLTLEPTPFPQSLMPTIGDYHFKSWHAYLATKVPLLREKNAERLEYRATIVD